LAITVGGQEIAIVSVETLTIPESFRDAVAERIGDRQLFLSATHTHSAPDSQMLNERMTLSVPGVAPYAPRWLDWYADKTAQAVETAFENAEAVSILELVQAEVALNRNRREGPKPDQNLTALKHGENLLFIHYTAHPILFESDRLRLHGDWPGALSVQEKSIILNGAIGDVSPLVSGGNAVEKCVEFVRQIGSKLAQDLEESTLEPERMNVLFIEESIDLPPVVASDDFAKEFGVPPVLAKLAVEKFAPPEARVTLVAFGDLLLIGVPGEPSTEVGQELKRHARHAGFARPLIVSNVNGWIGYVLTEKDCQNGGYEAALSFYGPQLGTALRQAVQRGLERLAEEG
jgi:hypothetical protein